MSKIIFINHINGADVIAHAAGCRDIKRDSVKHNDPYALRSRGKDFASEAEATVDYNEDFLADMGLTREEAIERYEEIKFDLLAITFKPCCNF